VKIRVIRVQKLGFSKIHRTPGLIYHVEVPIHPTKISGERVTLRRTAESDLPDLMRLWNDGRVMKWLGFPDGLDDDRHHVQNWFDRLQASHDRHHFVVHAEGMGFCGEVYYAADQVHQRAGLDIKLIPEAQGQGVATGALRSLIDHVFEVEPEIEAVWTEPSAENAPARRLYERCGLRPGPRPPDLEGDLPYWELRRTDWESVCLP
jgi:RimJ/RimL family protein N-acetyltransferase